MANCYTRFIAIAILLTAFIGCGSELAAPTAPSSTPTSAFESANDILHRCPTPAEVARSDGNLTLT